MSVHFIKFIISVTAVFSNRVGLEAVSLANCLHYVSSDISTVVVFWVMPPCVILIIRNVKNAGTCISLSKALYTYFLCSLREWIMQAVL